MELEVGVWLEMVHNIYYKRYIPFICERNEKFLILSMDFMFILIVWWIRQWVRVIYMWFFFGVCEVYCLMVIYEYFVINMWSFVYVYVKLIYMWFVLKSSVSFVINECLKYIRVSVWFWRWWVRVLVHANFFLVFLKCVVWWLFMHIL